MKLRIFGNSIRLRLSQTEVERLHTTGKVEECVSFGKSALTYTLESSGISEITASFENNRLVVSVPAGAARQWAASDEISLKAEKPLNPGESLKILIEKDFKCLTPRDEDESDNFPNPNKSC